jgi:serine O-acetyltransferase
LVAGSVPGARQISRGYGPIEVCLQQTDRKGVTPDRVQMNMKESRVVVSNELPDWSREEKRFFSWDPSRALLASIRSYQRNAKSRNPLRCVFLKKWAVLRHRFWSVVTGADISLNCQIEGGLLLPHPNGIVVHPKAKIGANCLIFQQVTIGITKGGQQPPVIGAHVDIGAGAKILGDVHIGDFALIGANAVVVKDVPSRTTARSGSIAEGH